MITWILVMVIYGSYGKAVDHVEGFTSAKDCQRAATFFMDANKKTLSSTEQNAFCLRKDTTSKD